MDEPAEIEVPDPDSPHGPWMLGRNSWHIHRAFYRQAGRPMHHGEYSVFRRQIKAGEAVTLTPGVYRVTARCGRALIIRFDGRLITALLAEDWSVEADAERRRQRAAQRASARSAPPPPAAPAPVAPPVKPVEAVAAAPALPSPSPS